MSTDGVKGTLSMPGQQFLFYEYSVADSMFAGKNKGCLFLCEAQWISDC